MESTIFQCAGRAGAGTRPRGALALVTALVSVVALTGCANLNAADRRTVASVGEDARADAAAGRAPSRGARGFTAEVLYQLLVAEFAGRRNRLDLAVENYLQAARDTGDAGVAERAVRIAVFARDLERGLEAAELWARLAPENMEAKRVHAALLVRSGRVGRAIEKFEEYLVALGEERSDGFSQIANVLARERNRDAAVEVMERLLESHPDDVDALLAFGQLAGRFGEFERAGELLGRVLEIDPGHARAVVLYAGVLQRQGDTAAAVDTLAGSVERNPEDLTLRMTFARLLVDAKRYEEARAQFERLAEQAPENADVRFALGLLLLQTNRPQEARAQFEKLIALGARTRAASFYLGQIAESDKNYDEAMTAYQQVDRGEHYLSAQIRVAVLMVEQGDVDAAREHLQALPRRNAEEAIRVYRAEAEILTREDRLEEALAVYDLALTEYPENSELLYARAMLAEKLDRIELLERDLRRILEREPDNADALNALGYTLADRTDRLEEAYDLIEKALALKPDNYYIIDSMGWVLYRMGRHEEAIDHLERALEINHDPEIAAHLGEVLWVSGKKQAAREVWNTALESTPDDERLLEVIERFSQ